MTLLLPKIKTVRKKRLGQGIGSGKGGHTSSRGQKGQKARRSLGIMFEGYKTRKSLYKRIPLLRGKGKLKPSAKPVILPLDLLNVFENDGVVTMDSIIEKGLVGTNARKVGVKILGNGKLERTLTVHLPLSVSAKEAVEKAGGKIVSPTKKARPKKASQKTDAKNANGK